MILAAGQGTRVRPLTKNLPKPMIPILGKPVMEYLIEHLSNYGITDIMVNVAHNHYKIEQYFGDGHRWDVQIGYAYEGTRARRDHSQTFWFCRRYASHPGLQRLL
jgi:mannose-1-phosphate guanylyltransferase